MGTHRTPKTENPGSGGRGSVRRRITAWQVQLTKAQWAERAMKLEARVSQLEGEMIRLAAMLYAYNAEKPDKKIVELAEVARVAAGEDA